MTRFAARRDWPRDVFVPWGYKVCLRCPVFIPITKSIPLCHGCARGSIYLIEEGTK